jgi:ankyrin repeat protein
MQITRRSIILSARCWLIVLLLALTGGQAYCVIQGWFSDLSLNERLFIAVSSGDVNWARGLLRQGASVFARDTNGITPLMCAAGCRSPQMAEMLINSGSALDATDHSGLTPLHYAVRGGHVEMVDLILRHEADAPPDRNDLIDFAHSCGSNEVVAFLRSTQAIMPAGFSAEPRANHPLRWMSVRS